MLDLSFFSILNDKRKVDEFVISYEQHYDYHMLSFIL